MVVRTPSIVLTVGLDQAFLFGFVGFSGAPVN